MPRTAPPPVQKVLSRGKGEHGAVVVLSRHEILALQQKYQPPMTAAEIIEKQEREANIPDNSHLTVWDPSTRR